MLRSTCDSAAKLHDGIGAELAERAGHQFRVADIAFDEMISGIVRDGGEVLQIPRIRELVKIGNLERASLKREADKAGADEARASGYQNFHSPTIVAAMTRDYS